MDLLARFVGRPAVTSDVARPQDLYLDVTLVRILWVLLTLLSGGLVLVAYLIAWILMPEEESTLAAPPVIGHNHT